MHNPVMGIEYDPKKANSNLMKHGVAFDEAATALLDPNALAMEDVDCQGENRWILIGMSDRGRLLTVVYTLRGNDHVRLISARKSTRKEGDCYA